MEQSIKLFDKEVPLFVSMWVCDEDRYFDLVGQRPKSVLWEAAALLWLCYCNACRYRRIKPDIDISEFELWADEQYSSAEGKENIVKVISALTSDMMKLTGKGEAAAETDIDKKKLIGQESGNLHLENAY